jgi:chromosome segregation ATPase
MRRVLATAAGLITEQRRCVEQQRQLVAELETMGVDISRARQRLARFEKMQQAHEERLTALQRETLEMGVAEVAEFLPAIVSSSDNDGDVHQRHSEVHRD